MTIFETTYNENYPKMYSVAFNMINDREAVRDIIQEIFIYYHRLSQNGNVINKPKSWLIRATINKCIDYSKHQKRFLKIDCIEPIPVNEDPSEIHHEKEIIKQALSKLKPKERTLAILYSENLSYKEIAEVTGIRLSSVGKMLSRTINQLNEILTRMNHEMY